MLAALKSKIRVRVQGQNDGLTRPSVHDALAESPLEAAVGEAAALPPENKFGGYALSNGWFFKKKLLGGFDGFRAVDLCWAYPKKVSTKAYGVVTTAVNWKMTMRIRPDRTVELYHESSDIGAKLPTASVDYTLKVLSQVTPWAIFGYSEYRAECWKKNHDTFLRLVDERLQAVRGALSSGKLRVDSEGTLAPSEPISLPTLVFTFLRKANGKVQGRRYLSSTAAGGITELIYKA